MDEDGFLLPIAGVPNVVGTRPLATVSASFTLRWNQAFRRQFPLILLTNEIVMQTAVEIILFLVYYSG